jgi:glycosyltransferase involved in cell wall biosynthesis
MVNSLGKVTGKTHLKVLLLSSPTSPLIEMPNRDGYSLRCNQFLSALLSYTEVSSVFSMELVKTSSRNGTPLDGNPERKYVSKVYPLPLREETSKFRIVSDYLLASLKAVAHSNPLRVLSNVDVVIIENAYPLFPLAMIYAVVARIMRRYVVIDFHDVMSSGSPINPWLRYLRLFLEACLVKISSKLIFVTSRERKYLTQLFGGIERSTVIPFAVEFYSHHDMGSAKWQLSDSYKNHRIILYVGDLANGMNSPAVDFIVRTLSPAFKVNPQVLFVCAGRGYNRWVEEPGTLVNGNVLFTGELSRSELDDLMNQSSLCIAPLSYNTGIKTKILDYCVHGRPVLASRQAAPGLPLWEMPSVKICDLDVFVQELANALENVDALLARTEITASNVKREFDPETFRRNLKKFILV